MKDTFNNSEYKLGFKLGLFFFVLLVVYVLMDKNIDNGLKVILVVLLYFILLADSCYDNGYDYRGKREDFSRFQYGYETPKGMTRRQTRLYNLNKDRGFLGQFYVQCKKCGRERIIEDRRKAMKRCLKQNEGYCMDYCQDGTDKKTLSFYNDNYIDTDAIFCYNCMMDGDTKSYMRNYRNFPYINGPPGTNTFTF